MPVKKGTKKQGKQPNVLLQQRQQRLELLFQEVDGFLERYKEDMLDTLKSFKEQREKVYNCVEKAFPEWLKNMPIKEVLEKDILGSNLLVSNPKESSQVNPAPIVSKKVDNSAILSKFATKHKLKQKEAVKQAAPPSKKRVSSIKRRSVLGKKVRSSQNRHSRVLSSQAPSTKKAVAASAGNESYVDVSDEEVFITPKCKLSSVITPKVDPRKTILRSQMRKPKPGELGFSLSGSPLLLENEITKPMSRSHSDSMSIKCGTKTYHFSDTSLRGCATLKERKMIVELQKKLNLMMKK